MSKFANKFTSYSTDSSLIINLTAKRDDGHFCDLGTREDQLQQEHQTELLIESAPHILSHVTTPQRERNETAD